MFSKGFINTATVRNDWQAQDLKKQGKKFEQCIHIEKVGDQHFAFLGAHLNSNLIGSALSHREAKKGARAWFNAQ